MPAYRNLTPNDEASFTIKEFCFLEKIAQATYHNLQKSGRAPVEVRIPGTRIVRITAKARRDWHEWLQKLAAESPEVAQAKREHAANSSKGGKIGAASPKHISQVKARRAAARKVA